MKPVIIREDERSRAIRHYLSTMNDGTPRWKMMPPKRMILIFRKILPTASQKNRRKIVDAIQELEKEI